MPFDLLPAIDLRGGSVVRLRRGDFADETRYGDDPATRASDFITSGATWIHVVDLDGARGGSPIQRDAVRSIVEAVSGRAQVEVAGGIRSDGDVGSALADGADRVVLGTAALTDPALLGALVDDYGTERIVVALDVRDGLAVGEGWRIGAAGVDAVQALDDLAERGVSTFAVTAIERDGLLGGPDLDLLGRLVELGRGAIIASGGIASIDDIRAVHDAGCAGAIVGRALYEGTIDLAEAVALVGTW